jgi:hypothetical protein
MARIKRKFNYLISIVWFYLTESQLKVCCDAIKIRNTALGSEGTKEQLFQRTKV